MKLVNISGVEFGGPGLPLIGGPCVIEGRDHTLKIAGALQEITTALDIPFIFKSSFDKANRTSIKAPRGPGLDEGLEIMQAVKDQLGLPVLTDIHLPQQAHPVAQVADMLQIPAFLCRQTDLLLAAAATGKPVNVKKGQFMDPRQAGSVIAKISSGGNNEILLTERGYTFGYNNLVTDVRALAIMREFGYPVIFDATHSAQMPGNTGSGTGGQRKYIPAVMQAAVAAGCDGLYLEIHDRPEKALSDAATQWPLERTRDLLQAALAINKTVNELNN